MDCQYLLKCRPRMMSLNCASTSFSVIDMNGTLTVYDITASSKDSSPPLDVSEIKLERKDVWDMRWSEDDPELFALMEKTKMYIFRGTEPEEPVFSSAYICEFRNLQIKAVLMDDIMQYPEKQSKENVINFETKSLRDTRNLLHNVSMQDAYQFVEDNSHPRLWHLLAEHAMDNLNLVIAEKAFVQCSDYHGIQFVKQLQTSDDVLKQQAQIASYFKRFDDAEKLYAELDRSDLAMRCECISVTGSKWRSSYKLVQVTTTRSHWPGIMLVTTSLIEGNGLKQLRILPKQRTLKNSLTASMLLRTFWVWTSLLTWSQKEMCCFVMWLKNLWVSVSVNRR